MLVIALLLTYFWINHAILSNFSLQLTAFLIIFLILAHRLLKTQNFLLTESVISGISVVLITASTGGLASPFFFLNHFLLFELSLLLEPSIVITLTLSLMTLYIFSHRVAPSFHDLTLLLSFLFMTPIAYFTGNIYNRIKNQKKEIKVLSEKIENLEEELTHEELERLRREHFALPA